MHADGHDRKDTKQNLILSALELFAEEGVDAVSMRTINNAAGTRNASAVHYHFGSKIGIIAAIIDFIKAELDAYRVDALNALEKRVDAGERPSCREIMWAAFTPYYQLYSKPGHGPHALKFLARLLSDVNPEVHSLLTRDPQRINHRFDALLSQALPTLPDEIRRLRYLFFWTMMVQGFANPSTPRDTVFGDLGASSTEEALLRFFDYLVGGLEGPVTTRP